PGQRHDHRSESDDRCRREDRKSTRLNSSHGSTSYAVFCLKKNIAKPFKSNDGRTVAKNSFSNSAKNWPTPSSLAHSSHTTEPARPANSAYPATPAPAPEPA